MYIILIDFNWFLTLWWINWEKKVYSAKKWPARLSGQLACLASSLIIHVIGYFNILKRSYNKEVKNFIQSYINYIIKPDFFVCFYIAFFIIFDKENIRVGFQGISLISFNPEAMISKLDIKLYISILIGPLLTEVDSWIFKIL